MNVLIIIRRILERFLFVKIKVEKVTKPCEGIQDADEDAIKGHVEENDVANVGEECAKHAVVVVPTVIEHAHPHSLHMPPRCTIPPPPEVLAMPPMVDDAQHDQSQPASTFSYRKW